MGKKEKKQVAEFVTKAEFDKVANAILDRLDDLGKSKASVPETKEEKEIKAAAPNAFEQNPIWEARARELLGDYLDHTEVEHDAGGGVKFTIVVKNERSNARADYLALAKVDRRTKEVSLEGLPGVISWCQLVKQNLKRTERLAGASA